MDQNMDYNADDAGFIYEDNEFLPENENSFIYPWLNQQQDIPHPDELLSIRRGPIVHEGFVPDDAYSELPRPDRLFDFEESESPNEATDDDEEHLEEAGAEGYEGSDDDADFAGSEDDVPPVDEMLSGDEALRADDDTGPFARTRRKRGRPRGPRIFTTSRGRYGRNMGRGGKGIKRGPRQPAEPSQQFNILRNAATTAFVDEQDLDKALDLIQRAIAMNPEVYPAHSLLSEIYFAQGDEEKAIAALLTGAHAMPKDPETWHSIADICLQRTSSGNRYQALHSASYCFARLLSIDKDDHDSRFQRAAISRQLGNRGKALKDLEKLLVTLPNNPSVLRQMAEVYTDMRRPQRAQELYERSIAYHQSVDDRDSFTFSDINVYVELFAHTNEYARGIAVLKSLSRWLLGRKGDTFWDLAQDDDREWDAEHEPRRTQVTDFRRDIFLNDTYGQGLPLELRVKLGVFRLKLGGSHIVEALNHFAWLEPGYEDPNGKVKDYSDLYRDVADNLKQAGMLKEALVYYEPLAKMGAYSDAAFDITVGSCLYETGRSEEAISHFERAKVSDPTSVEARLKLSRIYGQQGMIAKSRANAQEAITLGREKIMRPQRRRYERRGQREEREKAERELKTAHNLKFTKLKSISRGTTNIPLWRDGTSRQSLVFDPTIKKQYQNDKRRLREQKTRESAEELRTAYVASRYSALSDIQQDARAGDATAQESWLDIADGLINDFRSNKIFFPGERHMRFEGFDNNSRRRAYRKLHQKKAYDNGGRIGSEDSDVVESVEQTAVQTNIPTSYRGIPFSHWLDIFLEYSLLLARLGQEHKAQCYATLEAATDCTIWYHSQSSMLLIHTVWFSCALALEDADALNNTVLRWFLKEYQFATDVYGLFNALNTLHEYPPADKLAQLRHAEFRSNPTQKFFLRQVKANDFHLPQDYNTGDNAADDAGPVPIFMREEGRTMDEIKANLTFRDPETRVILPPEEMDIALLVLYGQLLYAGQSFPNALNYFFRAYALNNASPLVCFSIALAYVHQSLKRQSENRHGMIVRGMAFFQRYAECRLDSMEPDRHAEALQEIEFNRARIWHMLGISHLAAEGYWRVLQEDRDPRAKMDAALSLQMIYALSGDTERARHITEKYLVVE